jgi:hypothetical protein
LVRRFVFCAVFVAGGSGVGGRGLFGGLWGGGGQYVVT